MDVSQFDLSILNIDFFVKAFEVLFLLLFIIYAFLTVREVGLMNETLYTPIRVEVRLLAYLQLILGIGALVVILIN